MQKMVDEARAKGAQVVVLLSPQRHGRRPEDGQPRDAASTPSSAATRTTACRWPCRSSNPGGKTLVTNAGTNGKFLGVMDFDVKGGKVADFRYRLLPVFANMLPADPDDGGADRQGAARRTRRSWPRSSPSPTALLYRRGNFNGSWRPAAAATR